MHDPHTGEKKQAKVNLAEKDFKADIINIFRNLCFKN